MYVRILKDVISNLNFSVLLTNPRLKYKLPTPRISTNTNYLGTNRNKIFGKILTFFQRPSDIRQDICTSQTALFH